MPGEIRILAVVLRRSAYECLAPRRRHIAVWRLRVAHELDRIVELRGRVRHAGPWPTTCVQNSSANAILRMAIHHRRPAPGLILHSAPRKLVQYAFVDRASTADLLDANVHQRTVPVAGRVEVLRINAESPRYDFFATRPQNRASMGSYATQFANPCPIGAVTLIRFEFMEVRVQPLEAAGSASWIHSVPRLKHPVPFD